MALHTTKATVLRVEFLTTRGKQGATNIPLYPWDDLNQIKSDCRAAIASADMQITRMYKTVRDITNPLTK